MDPSIVALNVYQFLDTLQYEFENIQNFHEFILFIQNPPTSSYASVYDQWSPFLAHRPASQQALSQWLYCAEHTPRAADTLRKVAGHYRLLNRVSCFLDSDLEMDLFVRSLCLDSITPVQPKEIRETLFRFLNQLSSEIREMVMHILIEDEHGYFGREDGFESDFLDLDRVERLIADPELFEQVMATLQINTYLNLPWEQTLQDIHHLVRPTSIWPQLEPILRKIQTNSEPTEYASYEEYVQKNFLDDGGQEYLDAEIDRNQVEHMFQNLKM